MYVEHHLKQVMVYIKLESQYVIDSPAIELAHSAVWDFLVGQLDLLESQTICGLCAPRS